MARLTMKTGGKRGINWHVARHVKVKTAIDAHTQRIGAKAEAIHTAYQTVNNTERGSFIELDRGEVDGYVVLNDSESGRKGAKGGAWMVERKSGALRKAAGLA